MAVSLQDRIGIGIWSGMPDQMLSRIQAAEAAGLKQIWATQSPTDPDTLTTLGAAAALTQKIRLGTAIVPFYPRHPVAMAAQALTIASFAPGRFRLGIGTSSKGVVEDVLGLSFANSMAHLREYISVVKQLLADGCADFHGQFLNVQATMLKVAQVPVLMSALGTKAFYTAGEVADGAISWMCTLDYLLNKALPAMSDGAASVGRARPPLIAQVPVTLSRDMQAARASARPTVEFFMGIPYYRNMFIEAGFAVDRDPAAVDALIDALVVIGDEAAIAERLKAILDAGVDEIIVAPTGLGDDDAGRARLAELIVHL